MSYSDQPPPPPAYGAPPPGAAASGNSSKALWSLITGILSILCCSPLGIVAIILGRGAQSDIRQTGQGGEGMAKAGVILGIIGLIFLVITIILFATGAMTFDGTFETG